MSEVSGSLQAGMVLFSSGEEKLGSLRVQSLDDLLDCSPKHPPQHTLRKDFNGEAPQECLCTGVTDVAALPRHVTYHKVLIATPSFPSASLCLPE